MFNKLCVKRINRDNSQWTEVFLFNADKTVINELINQFRNINIKECEIKITRKERQTYNTENRKADSYPVKFIDLLKNLKSGEYTKIWCMDQIGYDEKTHFSRLVLQNEDVKKYLYQNSICVNSHSVILI